MRRWTVPGALHNGLPVPGVALADGLNFIVPARTADGYATYLCRPGGKTELMWPEYFRPALNMSLTPDGAVWGVSRATVPAFHILTSEGRALPGVPVGRIAGSAGMKASDEGVFLLRAAGGYLWFNAGDRYLVRAAVDDPANLKTWKFPKVVNNRVGVVTAAIDGIFITAVDGVHFMDWSGNAKKIY